MTPLLLLKPKTNNELNTIELQTTVSEQGAWSMVKLLKLNLAHNLLARAEHRKEQEAGKLSSKLGEWRRRIVGDVDRKHALSMAQMWPLNDLDGWCLRYLVMPHQ
jgi:hypothetical protein